MKPLPPVTRICIGEGGVKPQINADERGFSEKYVQARASVVATAR